MSKATDILLSLKAPAVLSSDQITELKQSWLSARGVAREATEENYQLRLKLVEANKQLSSLANHNALQQPEITRLRAELAKVTNEAAQHKITADYAKRHLEQCETALSAEQNKREEVEQQLAKANERVALLERVEKIFNESPELTFENVKSMFSEELNKLAIEKKIEAVIFYGEKLKEIGFSGVDSYTDQVKEMLRKEQE